MNQPREEQWLRVEQLADQLSGLPPEDAASRLSQLAAEGESATVLTLVSTYISLPPTFDELQPGLVFGGRYTLRQKLGEGGMGSVWRARQEMIARDVALKIIHPLLVTPALQQRFIAEMKALGNLDHPGIVKIFDAGMHERTGKPPIPYFVMELVEGVPLSEWSAAHRHDIAAQLKLMAALCAAIQSAHERRIVHRDLKPANILVRQNGQPILLDFGIARLAGIVLGEEYGSFSGTPQYAAPEQHLGRDRDFRSGESVDVYAAGAILFEMLAGRRLFEVPRGTPFGELRRLIVEGAPPRLTEHLPNCPEFLEEIVARAVRRDPADRFYSMSAFSLAIHRALDQLSPPAVKYAPWTPAFGAIVPGTQWKLTEKLGEGGTGDVWTGIHQQLGERRVFKFCDTEEKARTLKRELTLFRLLKERVGRNPHFVPLHEVSLDESPFYLMMDYVDARDLESWSASQPGGFRSIAESTRLEIVIQAAEALQAAHEAGILHRDIKPSNLLVREGTETGLHVLVADFGIGQLAADELLRGGTRLGFTRTVAELRGGPLSGTMLYLAPELLAGNAATARSDIYSLGVVLWQLLIGNLNLALDPAEWAARIEDPLLREDLSRCLAGSPDRRWASAGEFAAQLRALPERRAAQHRRQQEIATRERAAYRRGLVRATAVATAVVALVLGLAVAAWTQWRGAERARGESALEQASALHRSDLSSGRRKVGFGLLQIASARVTNRVAVRSAVASVMSLTDLEPVTAPSLSAPPPPAAAKLPGEVLRETSPDGTLTAVARDLDGLNGAIDLIDNSTGKIRLTLQRKDFPWIPVAEPGLLRFSSEGRKLAVGGAATSRQVLVFDTASGALLAYIFHGSDPISCAWHPSGQVIATGSLDGTVRLWQLAAARVPTRNASAKSDFDLPPKLDAPALDVPLHLLPGQRGPVQHLAYTPDGEWLAALDREGYLRVYASGYSVQNHETNWVSLSAPPVAVEAWIEAPEQIASLHAETDLLILRRTSGAREAFRIARGELPKAIFVGSDLAQAAWSRDGAQLCLSTLTDVHWLNAGSLRRLVSARGINAAGVATHGADSWLLAGDQTLDVFRLTTNQENWSSTRTGQFPLHEAVKGQGVRTRVTTAADGRVAAYHGRRIQFVFGDHAAGTNRSVIADGAEGEIRSLFWDAPGRLLGAVFSRKDGDLHLEAWQTSADFPPTITALLAGKIDAQRIAPANDGRHVIARGQRQGLLLLDPKNKTERAIDLTKGARQSAPLAASADGRFLAMVVDRHTIRLLRLPDGQHYADLPSPRLTGITELAWDPGGQRLVSFTEDGYLQVWNLAAWRQWLTAHQLENF